jgi:outer membrane protein OmpA-like peptidoglycan-associated protein
MRFSVRIAELVALLLCASVVAGCSGTKTADTQATAAASESPESESASPSAEGGSPVSPGAAESTGSPTPAPSPTPYANLLRPENGTIVRSYPAGLDPSGAWDGVSIGPDVKPPYAFVWELPGVATITSFVVQLGSAPAGQTPGATVAVSTTSAIDGFHDVGTVQTSGTGMGTGAGNLSASVKARWVRLTIDESAKTLFGGLQALGTLDPRPVPAALPTGIFVEADPYRDKTGAFAPDPGPSKDPWYVRLVGSGSNANSIPQPSGTTAFGTTATESVAGSSAPAGDVAGSPTSEAGLSGQRCYDGRVGDAYPGSFDGRFWTWRSGDSQTRMVVNDDGSILSNGGVILARTTRTPKWCEAVDGGGTGSTKVLLLVGDTTLYPVGDRATDAHGMHFDIQGAGLLDPSELAKYSIVMLNGLCKADTFFSPQTGRALSDWVATGHKLFIYDADMCGHETSYAFLPYPFTTNNPGANGAKGDRLIEVENDQFGSLDASDKAHFFDPKPFAVGQNQLGDANTVTSHDSHWCGHLFGTNVNHVNGFMQMYAPYGKGLIVYDGLDHDDGGNQYYERIRLLELGAAIDGNNPCTQSVSLAFLIEPSQSTTFVPGKAVTRTFALELLANQGWTGHVNLTTSGDFPGTVSPAGLDVAGGTTPLRVAIRIPASAKPGQYAIIVNGDGGAGSSSQATISLDAAVPIVKQLKVQRRIRLYGIHFDVDSARIQPRSEPVIAQVAEIMRENPQWRFRIEGHTDSDGGVAHNVVLSQHRAQSVIDDLVKRYHIARGRMVAAGYGLSRPVASNATEAGKALNRRVELVRL